MLAGVVSCIFLMVVVVIPSVQCVLDKKDWISFLPEDAKVPKFALPRRKLPPLDSIPSSSINNPQISAQFPSQPFSVVVVPNLEGVDSSEVLDRLRKELNITDVSISQESQEDRELFVPSVQIPSTDSSESVEHFKESNTKSPLGNSFFVFNQGVTQSQSVTRMTSSEPTVNQNGNHKDNEYPVPTSYKANRLQIDVSDEEIQDIIKTAANLHQSQTLIPLIIQSDESSSVEDVHKAKQLESFTLNNSESKENSSESLELSQLTANPILLRPRPVPSFINPNADRLIPVKLQNNLDSFEKQSDEIPFTVISEDDSGLLSDVDSSEFRKAFPSLFQSVASNDNSSESVETFEVDNSFQQDSLPVDSVESFETLKINSVHNDLKDGDRFLRLGKSFDSESDWNNAESHANLERSSDEICIDGKCFPSFNSAELDDLPRESSKLKAKQTKLEPSEKSATVFVTNHSPCIGENCHQMKVQEQTPPLNKYERVEILKDIDSSEKCLPTTIFATATSKVLQVRTSTIYNTVTDVIEVPTVITSTLVYTETQTSIIEAPPTTSTVYKTSTLEITSKIVEPKTINVVTTEYPVQIVTHTHRHRYTEIVPVSITTTRTDITRTNPVDYAVLRPLTETITSYTTKNILTTEVATQYVTVTIMSPSAHFQTHSTLMTETKIVTVTHIHHNKPKDTVITVTVRPTPPTITKFRTTTYTKTMKSEICSPDPYRTYGKAADKADKVSKIYSETWSKDGSKKTGWQQINHFRIPRLSNQQSNYNIYSAALGSKYVAPAGGNLPVISTLGQKPLTYADDYGYQQSQGSSRPAQIQLQ